MKIYKCSQCRKNYRIFPPKELKKKHSHNYKCYICGKYYYPTPQLPKLLDTIAIATSYWHCYLEKHPDVKFINLILHKIKMFKLQVYQGEDSLEKENIKEQIKVEGTHWLYWINHFYLEYSHLDILNPNYISKSRR